jgi:hypothetical protein
VNVEIAKQMGAMGVIAMLADSLRTHHTYETLL